MNAYFSIIYKQVAANILRATKRETRFETRTLIPSPPFLWASTVEALEQMTISIPVQIKRLGLAAAIAAFAYQPAMQANMQSSRQTFELPSPTAPMIDTLVAATPNSSANLLDSAAATKQVAQGAPFVSAAHATSGSAQIVEENGQRYLEFDSSFRSDSGPDLFVLLHRDAVPESYSPESYVNLGRIQEFEGAQRYAIPADVDIAQLQSAVIWCREFNVTFGYATL